VQHSAHGLLRAYLVRAFGAQIGATKLVLGDCQIVWDVPRIRPHGPDVMIIPGTWDRPNWYSFDVAAEGTRPELIVEITSSSTRHADLVTKPPQYYRAGLAFYVIADLLPRRNRRATRPLEWRLLGFRRGRQGFVRLRPDDRGWLWLPPVWLWMGIDGDRVYCYAAEGQRVGDYEQVRQALQEAEERARQAEERVRALEAELRRLRGGP
jgi:Uma2 family endonuclease